MKVIARVFHVVVAIVLFACIGWQVRPAYAQTTWVISGTTGVPGTTLSYFDGTAKTATADGNGNYSFTVSDGFDGMVTPSKAGYTVVFTPSSINYSSTPVTSDQSNQNYVPDTSWWTISGNAGVAGATLDYNDGSPESVTADVNGDYALLVPDTFAGVITPSKTGYTFTPTSKDYSSTPVTANLTGENYTATAITYTISGNAGVAGATLSYVDGTPKTATADGSGNYSFAVSYNWPGTVTPSKTGYTFTPTSKDYSSTPVLSNLTAQNYTATAITYTISGNAGVAGATLKYTDGTPKTAVSNGSGLYSFTVSYGWSGTVTPSKVSSTIVYTFGPASRNYTNVLANKVSQNYTVNSSSAIPTPQSPTGTISDSTPTYKWTRIASATQYEFQLFRGTTLIYKKAVPASACPTGPCSSTPATVLSDNSYRWNVRAKVGGVWKTTSAFKNFKLLTIPTPKTPTGVIYDSTPTFQWTAIAGATQYQYQVLSGAAVIYTQTVAAGVCQGGNCTGTAATDLNFASYTWKVRAKIGTAWRPFSTTKSFTILSIVNGDFENGRLYGWSEYSTHGWDVVTTGFPGSVFPHSGSWAAWLGGDNSDTSYVAQTVTISSKAPYLTYWHWIASADSCGRDFGSVWVNGTTVEVYTLCTSTNTGGWTPHAVYLGAYAGSTVTIYIRVDTNSSTNSNLFVDDVMFLNISSLPPNAESVGSNLDAATFGVKNGIVAQGDAPEGLVPQLIVPSKLQPK